MPRRSTGCSECRRRKVRCDETKPLCKRCTIHRVECPGYRPSPEHDFHFVKQSQHSKHSAGVELVSERDLTPGNGPKMFTQLRWRHESSNDVIRITGPGTTKDTHLHRMQLLSKFVELQLPRKRDESVSHFAYLSALPSVDLSTPLLQISVDTLCLAALGTLQNDGVYLQESRNRYIQALRMLVNQLAKQSRQVPEDHILASITVLANCELFGAIAMFDESNQGWLSHVQGAQQYLRWRGPGAIRSPFSWLLFHMIRHSSLYIGLARRQAVFLSCPEWLNLTKHVSNNDPYVSLYDLALQIPGLLEQADAVTEADDLNFAFAEVCRISGQLRKDFGDWHRSWHIPTKNKSFATVDVYETKEFFELSADRTFPTVFTFPSVQTCMQYQLYWICCLLLDFTIAELCRLHNIEGNLCSFTCFTTRSKESVRDTMSTNASNYCRSIPYCCGPDMRCMGRTRTFFLNITQRYFHVYGHDKEYEWCRAVYRMLESKNVPRYSIWH